MIPLRLGFLAVLSLTAAPDFFQPDPVWRFNGRAWGGLEIGRDTTDSIKREFKTSKGSFRPEGMVLPQPNRNDPKIEVLMDGRGGASGLVGFFATYGDQGPDPEQVGQRLDLEPEVWYAPDRYDDWALVTFPERGIALAVVGGGRVKTTTNAMLLRPRDLTRITDGMRREPGRIRDPRSIFDQRPPVLSFTRVNVNINLKNVDSRDKGAMERDLAEDIRRSRHAQGLEFRSSGNDTYSVFINAEFNRDKGVVDIRANATISGNTGYGQIYATGTGTDSARANDTPYWGSTRNLDYAVERAVRDAERDASDKIRRQQPPTPEQLRNQFLFDAMNRNVR